MEGRPQPPVSPLTRRYTAMYINGHVAGDLWVLPGDWTSQASWASPHSERGHRRCFAGIAWLAGENERAGAMQANQVRKERECDGQHQ